MRVLPRILTATAESVVSNANDGATGDEATCDRRRAQWVKPLWFSPVIYVGSGHKQKRCQLPALLMENWKQKHVSDYNTVCTQKVRCRGYVEQEAQLSQRDRAILRVIEYFARSLGHSRSLDRSHTRSCWRSVVTIALFCIISEIKRDIGRKLRFFFISPTFNVIQRAVIALLELFSPSEKLSLRFICTTAKRRQAQQLIAYITRSQCDQCCKGDASSKWEKENLPLSPHPHPLTDSHEILHMWLRPPYLPTFCQDRPRGYFPAYSQSYHSIFFISFFVRKNLSTNLELRPLNRFCHAIYKRTRIHAW